MIRKLPLLSQLKDGDQVTVTGLCKSIKEKSIKGHSNDRGNHC